MRKIAVLYVGPRHHPITGQSEAFELLASTRLPGEAFIDYPPGSFWGKNFYFIIKIFFYVIFYRPKAVYLSITRSKLGFLRDAVVIWLSKFFKAKVIVHLHGADFYEFRQLSPYILKWLILKTYNRVDSAIVLGNSMRSEFREFPNILVHSVSNSVSFEIEMSSQQASAIRKLDNRPLNVLFLSNLIPSKGIIEAIEAVKCLRKEGFPVELEICGRLGFSTLVDNRIANLPDGIRYNGSVFDRKKINFLKKADIVCLPSYYPTEAQPISLIEGMYFGCAVIFSNHNYLPDFFSTDVGFCVATKSATSISDALREYLKNPNLLYCHSQRARQAAILDFNRGSHCKKVREIINET